ncbi:exported hypothetical protein [Mesorhizobium plurifarium]|uniref:Uncharacterized protein n=1 Tax=Mesorhizobium plurifarium TaxID=69974 RepID=A0A090DPA0_MESPL|nr:exported hypothetical protein [Mesorhizobium plurifarium]
MRAVSRIGAPASVLMLMAFPSIEAAALRAFHRFMETANRSILLFLRNSGRKNRSHFSWDCSSKPARSIKSQDNTVALPAITAISRLHAYGLFAGRC